MAAPLEHTNGGLSASEVVGISYADAVLNLKNNGENNKENIGYISDSKAIKENSFKSNQSHSERANTNPAFVNEKPGKYDDFPRINSKFNRNKHGDRDKRNAAGNCNGPEYGNCNGNHCDKSKVSAKGKPNDSEVQQEQLPVIEKIKYVEAPLPKINPWTIKRNSANSIPSASLPSVIPCDSEQDTNNKLPEKRQHTLGK